MNYEQIWNELKNELEMTVKEGYNKGLQSKPETSDGGKLIAYRYVLETMEAAEEKERKQ